MQNNEIYNRNRNNNAGDNFDRDNKDKTEEGNDMNDNENH